MLKASGQRPVNGPSPVFGVKAGWVTESVPLQNPLVKKIEGVLDMFIALSYLWKRIFFKTA